MDAPVPQEAAQATPAPTPPPAPKAKPLPSRQFSLASLDLSLSGTWTLYLLVVLAVGRYTMLSWVDFGAVSRGEFNPFAALFGSGWVNFVAMVAAAYIHLIPWFAFRKARLVERDLEREQKVARRLLERSNELLTTRTAELERKGIESLATRFFGADLIAKDEVDTGANRIAQDVLRRVQMLRFEPTAALVRPYREALASRLPDITKYQRVSLQLGIMSTFFGLMIVFSRAEFSSSVGSGGGAVAMASSLIGGLNLAFGGSVAGLISSVAIILFMDHLRKETVLVARLHEQEAEQIMAVAHLAFNDPALRDNLVALEYALKFTNSQVEGVRRDLQKANELQAQTVQGVVTVGPKVAEAVHAIEVALQGVTARQAEMVTAMTGSYQKMTPEALGDQIYKALRKGFDETDRQLRATADVIQQLSAAAAHIEAAHLNARVDALDVRNTLQRIEREIEDIKDKAEIGPSRLPFGIDRLWRRAKPRKEKPARLSQRSRDDEDPPRSGRGSAPLADDDTTRRIGRGSAPLADDDTTRRIGAGPYGTGDPAAPPTAGSGAATPANGSDPAHEIIARETELPQIWPPHFSASADGREEDPRAGQGDPSRR